mgnify:CR=1 FL=1
MYCNIIIYNEINNNMNILELPQNFDLNVPILPLASISSAESVFGTFQTWLLTYYNHIHLIYQWKCPVKCRKLTETSVLQTHIKKSSFSWPGFLSIWKKVWEPLIRPKLMICPWTFLPIVSQVNAIFNVKWEKRFLISFLVLNHL